jgi:hypothetical protein
MENRVENSVENRPQNRTETRPKRWQPCHKETCQGGSCKRGYPTLAFTVAVCTAIDGYRKRPDTVGELKSADICGAHMPSLKAKKLGKLAQEKVLLEL